MYYPQLHLSLLLVISHFHLTELFFSSFLLLHSLQLELFAEILISTVRILAIVYNVNKKIISSRCMIIISSNNGLPKVLNNHSSPTPPALELWQHFEVTFKITVLKYFQLTLSLLKWPKQKIYQIFQISFRKILKNQ